jgi:hypothetical protein
MLASANPSPATFWWANEKRDRRILTDFAHRLIQQTGRVIHSARRKPTTGQRPEAFFPIYASRPRFLLFFAHGF